MVKGKIGRGRSTEEDGNDRKIYEVERRGIGRELAESCFPAVTLKLPRHQKLTFSFCFLGMLDFKG